MPTVTSPHELISAELLKPGEAAAMLRCSQSLIYKWIRNGELPALSVGSTYRIKRSHIEQRLVSAQTQSN